MSSTPTLDLRDDEHGHAVVCDSRVVKIERAGQMMTLLEKGNGRRICFATGGTQCANVYSMFPLKAAPRAVFWRLPFDEKLPLYGLLLEGTYCSANTKKQRRGNSVLIRCV